MLSSHRRCCSLKRFFACRGVRSHFGAMRIRSTGRGFSRPQRAPKRAGSTASMRSKQNSRSCAWWSRDFSRASLTKSFFSSTACVNFGPLSPAETPQSGAAKRSICALTRSTLLSLKRSCTSTGVRFKILSTSQKASTSAFLFKFATRHGSPPIPVNSANSAATPSRHWQSSRTSFSGCSRRFPSTGMSLNCSSCVKEFKRPCSACQCTLTFLILSSSSHLGAAPRLAHSGGIWPLSFIFAPA
mmetsp:Transcript_60163/g.107153  ORF Transcript_60163/g.107153 Transcript_60163/m.107153 type:complete len:243 (-) Transcript_60163:1531-2259(-)